MAVRLSFYQYKNHELNQQWTFQRVVHLLKADGPPEGRIPLRQRRRLSASETITDATVSRPPPAEACDLCCGLLGRGGVICYLLCLGDGNTSICHTRFLRPLCPIMSMAASPYIPLRRLSHLPPLRFRTTPEETSAQSTLTRSSWREPTLFLI